MTEEAAGPRGPSYCVQSEWLCLRDVARELGMDYGRVLGWARRKADPLPARLIDGNRKQARVFRPQLNEWLMRNSEGVMEHEACM